MGCTSSKADIESYGLKMQHPQREGQQQQQENAKAIEKNKKDKNVKQPLPDKNQSKNQQQQMKQSVQKKKKKKVNGFFDPTLENEINSKQLKSEKIQNMAKDKKDPQSMNGGTALGKGHKLDTDGLEMFEVADVGHGDESMACQPWKGAIAEPVPRPKINTTLPDISYQIDFVYGYKNEEARQNLFYNHRRRPVYMTAAMGIILDPKNRTQLIFGGKETSNMSRKQTDFTVDSHTDDVMCLCIDQTRSMVATGQVGHSPIVFVWESNSAVKLGTYRLPKGMRSITAIAFNKDAKYIACADFSNDHNIYVHDWKTGVQAFKATTGGNKIFMIDWSLLNDTFCSVGPKHVFFWDMKGKKTAGKFGGATQQTNLLCVAGDEKGNFFTGSQDGRIMKWGIGSIMKEENVHKGIIHCIRYVKDPAADKGILVTGAADLTIKILDPESFQIQTSINVEAIPRSLDVNKFLLIGLANGSILEYDVNTQSREIIMHSHHDGEVWGLTTIEGQGLFFTSCDDNKIFLFDIMKKKKIQQGQVELIEDSEEQKKQVKQFKGGASTTSSEPPQKQSRALAYNVQLQHLAVADNTGNVTIREVTFEASSNLNQVIYTLTQPQEWIECMSYNPQNNKLAVGSHEIYNNKQYIKPEISPLKFKT